MKKHSLSAFAFSNCAEQIIQPTSYDMEKLITPFAVPFCIIFGVFTLGILYCLWSGRIDIELWNAIKLIGKGNK